MLNNKSQALSIYVIIIAAIIFIVFIVSLAVFLGRLGGFTKELVSCRGTCDLSEGECKYPRGVKAPEGECPNPKIHEPTKKEWFPSRVCCILLGG